MWPVVLLLVLGMLTTGFTGPQASGTTAAAPASKVTLTVLNPQGTVPYGKDLAPRLKTLDGKKVALWLSASSEELYAGKGEVFYNRLSELLTKQFPKIEIIPPSKLPLKYSPAEDILKALKDNQAEAVVIALGG